MPCRIPLAQHIRAPKDVSGQPFQLFLCRIGNSCLDLDPERAHPGYSDIQHKISEPKPSQERLQMRGLKVLLCTSALFTSLALVPAAKAQLVIGIGGAPPVCSYGYYDYAPYSCAPYGYFGPGYFYNGIFLGVGPWANWGYGHGWGGHRFSGGGGGRYVGGGRGGGGAAFRGGGGGGRAVAASRGGGGGGHAAVASRGGGGGHAVAASRGGGGGHAAGGGGHAAGGGGGHAGGGGGHAGGGGGHAGGGGGHAGGGGGGGHR
jgi:hypothetical protein